MEKGLGCSPRIAFLTEVKISSDEKIYTLYRYTVEMRKVLKKYLLGHVLKLGSDVWGHSHDISLHINLCFVISGYSL